MPTPRDPQAVHVPRHEFDEFKSEVRAGIAGLSDQIGQLVRSKQVNWTLIISIVAVLVAMFGGALGFGISNLTKVAALEGATASVGLLSEELRERTRALEAQLRGITTESETQHRWMADVVGLQIQMLDLRHRTRCSVDPGHPVVHPDIDYWPLAGIGHANGSKLE